MKREIFFASNLKYLRLKKGLEQKDVAKLLNLKSSSSVTNWEKGYNLARTSHLLTLASFFGVTLGEFIHTDLQKTRN